ncbi:MAG: hypothetical protein JO295_10025 [Verrucomicrobia bacterium]|nr:hypothetical protein [Verrucomicrobiota bacterium]
MDVLTTSDPEKLPPEVRVLLDETQPLPPGTAFFEQRFSAAWLIQNALIGLGLLGFGALLLLLGVVWLFAYRGPVTVYSNSNAELWLIVVGLVLGVGGWMMLASFPAGWALGRRQNAGARTRYGIFLLPGILVSRSWFDTTVIPREHFRGLASNALRYDSKGQTKSYTLPPEWIGSSLAQLAAAIHAWSQQPSQPGGGATLLSATPPPLPPPLPPSPRGL